MKSFTERSPRAIGAVAIVVILAFVLGVLGLNRNIFSSTYPLSARFSSAAGITPGTDILLAGVPVGRVQSLSLQGNHVNAILAINSGVELPSQTNAAISVETLLGVLDVTLQPVSGWSHPLHAGSVIAKTSVPTELYQLQTQAGKLLSNSNAKALNTLVQSLANITAGKQKQVREIIEGLNDLTGTIAARSGQVSSLIDASNNVAGTLANRDQTLAQAIDELTTVVGGLASHSTQLNTLLQETDNFATQTQSLASRDDPALNSLLEQLHTVLTVIAGHQDDLAEGVAYLGAAVKGFSSIGYSGTADTPNTWANIFVDPLGETSTYGALTACGAFDDALDEILGPDPLPCDEQTGPIPGSSTSGSSAQGGATTHSSTGRKIEPLIDPNSGVRGLCELLCPLEEVK